MTTQLTRQQQIDAIKKDWAENPRWKGVKRPFTAEEVVALRGSFVPENTIAQRGAAKLWELVNGGAKKGYVNSLGALTGGQAVQQAKAGIEAIYLSGWQVAADANLAGTMYPDQSLYPANSVPAVVSRINNSFRRADQIQWSKEVPMDFDARRSAIYRRYDYCLKTKKPDVFLNSRALYIDYLIDIERMKLAAKYLIGKHDFSSFRASSCQSKSPIREMQSIDFINEDNNCLRISFIGNAFLHHMIRNIMGTLIDVGIGRLEPDQMKEILESKDRQKASKTVSPEGLYLIGIKYPEKYKLPTKDIEIRLSNLDL